MSKNMTYRNIGESALQDASGSTVVLNRLGQKVELTEEQVALYRANERDSSPRPALVTEQEFESIGLTEAELNDFPSASSQQFAPPETQEKLTRLRELFIGLTPKDQESTESHG